MLLVPLHPHWSPHLCSALSRMFSCKIWTSGPPEVAATLDNCKHSSSGLQGRQLQRARTQQQRQPGIWGITFILPSTCSALKRNVAFEVLQVQLELHALVVEHQLGIIDPSIVPYLGWRLILACGILTMMQSGTIAQLNDSLEYNGLKALHEQPLSGCRLVATRTVLDTLLYYSSGTLQMVVVAIIWLKG
eukprot:565499-Amphidinium_carterae.1